MTSLFRFQNTFFPWKTTSTYVADKTAYHIIAQHLVSAKSCNTDPDLGLAITFGNVQQGAGLYARVMGRQGREKPLLKIEPQQWFCCVTLYETVCVYIYSWVF